MGVVKDKRKNEFMSALVIRTFKYYRSKNYNAKKTKLTVLKQFCH